MLYQKGLVNNVAELYKLKNKREELVKLEKMGEKSVDNMLNAIENSKKRPSGQSHLRPGHTPYRGGDGGDPGPAISAALIELANASREELMYIPTIGPKIADSILAFFRQEENRNIIQQAKRAGVLPDEEAAAKPAELPLSGMEFVITGRLENFSREEAEAKIKELGGTAKDNVTRKTNYVVVGADPGDTKLARARELGIKQLNEEEFINLLKQK